MGNCLPKNQIVDNNELDISRHNSTILNEDTNEVHISRRNSIIINPDIDESENNDKNCFEPIINCMK